MKRKIAAFFIAGTFVVGMACPVYADSVDTQPYLSLGEDLSSSELSTVLEIFGIDEDDLDEYDVTYITNDQEHEYLDEYLSSSTIGSRALSCALVTEAEEGSGVTVETTNISYCTTGMYENALVTAGIEDAEVQVAGPFSISGTAALVGAALAYSEMTGEEVDEDAVDAAIEEVVITGEIKENTDSEEEIEGVIAYVKEELANGDLTDENIDETLDEAEEAFNVTLSDEDRELIKQLIDKLDTLDLDADAIADQAQSIYDKLSASGYDIDIDSLTEEVSGIFSKLVTKLKSIFSFLN